MTVDQAAQTAPAATASASSPDALAAMLWLAGAGDHAAFQALFDNVAPWLFAAAFRITRDVPTATDAVQATLRQVWRGAARSEPEGGSPAGRLLAAVRQRAIDLHRRRQREGIAPDLAERGGTAAEDIERLAQQPAAQSFHAAFATLGHDQRQLLALAFLDGLSHAELAQRLRMPIGTARSQVRASLDRLRRSLEVTA